jgi:hypothetical protein
VEQPKRTASPLNLFGLGAKPVSQHPSLQYSTVPRSTTSTVLHWTETMSTVHRHHVHLSCGWKSNVHWDQPVSTQPASGSNHHSPRTHSPPCTTTISATPPPPATKPGSGSSRRGR